MFSQLRPHSTGKEAPLVYQCQIQSICNRMDERRSRTRLAFALSRTNLMQQRATPQDRKWNEEWLYELSCHQTRQDEFEPRANLCIRTDIVDRGSGVCMSMADLAHTCLSNYFTPYKDAASVTWTTRDELRRMLLTQAVEANSDRIEDYIANMNDIEKQLDDIDAILYLSRDARDFMSTHRDSFLDTIALCLRSSRRKIILLDMCMKPDTLV